MASLAARMRGVRLERGLASFRNGCCTPINKEKGGKKNSQSGADLIKTQEKFNEEKKSNNRRQFFNLQQLFASASFLYIHFQTTVEEISEDWRQLLWVLKLGCAVRGNQV